MKQPHHTCITIRLWMRLFFLFFPLFLAPILTVSQHIHFRNISTKEGLTSNSVYRIYEDKSGYFWYLTDKGVSRFDGTNWKHFTSADGYDDLGAFHILETRDSTVWVLTTNFKLYCFRSHKFKKIDNTTDISWIEADEDNLWVLTRNKRILKLSEEGVVVKMLDIKPMQSIQACYSILKLEDGHFFVSTNTGIYSYDEDQKQKLILPIDKVTLIVPRMFQRKNGDIVLSNNNGVYNYNLQRNELTLIQQLSKNELISFYEDAEGLVLGTFNGLYKLSTNSSKQIKPKLYLRNNIISSVFRSHSGIYYFSTLNSGGYYSNFNVSHIDSEAGLNKESIAFVRILGKDKYLFTKSGLVYKLNGDNTSIERIKLGKVGEIGRIYNIISVSNNQLLIGSNKLYSYDGKHLSLLDTSRIIEKYFLIYYNKDYLSSPKLTQLIFREDTLSRYFKFIDEFLKKKRFELKVDHSLLNTGNKIFFQVEEGLLEIEYNYLGVSNYKIYNEIDFVSDIKMTKNNVAIVSTLRNGLFTIFRNKVTNFSLKDGLASNYCSKSYILNSVIWVCTNKGLSKITLGEDLRMNSLMIYSSENYLLDDQVNDLDFDKEYVYVATDKGLSFFDSNLHIKHKMPSVFIESVKINNIETPVDSLDDLPYNQNTITVKYSIPIEWSGNSLYKYVFNNGDTLYTKSTEISYGSLLPGIYELKIWGRNHNGSWSLTPALLHFSISQPFWKTKLFILFIIIFLGGLTSVFFVYRLNQLKKRNAIEAQLLESELRALRLHMNPHFIFNTLNSLQKFTLVNNPIEANKFIAKFSRLMRWIMSYSDKQYISLEEEINFLDTYISLEQLRFDRVFSVFREIDERIQPSRIFIPALVIQPFVENAVKYGLSGLTYEGQLHITFKWNESFLTVTVQDNGVGREKIKQEQLLSGKEFESTGIKYTNERLLLLLENKLKVENAVTVIDLYATDGSASGTRVELIIPYYYE